MSQSILVLAARTLSTIALASLATASSPSTSTEALQHSARLDTSATSESAPLDTVNEIAKRLINAGDIQLEGFRLRWSNLPVDLQARLALAVARIDSDRKLEVLASMLETRDDYVRGLVCDALRAETDQKLPDSSELWTRWLDSEKTWLRLRGAQVIEDLRSSDEAAVVRATREIGERRLNRRAFATELERNLGRLSPAIRSVTARTLGQLGDANSRDALTAALGDRAPAVRREAEKALTRLDRIVG